MDVLSDPIVLARLQFAFTALYHFLFVPLSIGMGLIMAIFVTKASKTGLPEDIALSKFWVRIFSISFAVGVATGITMEFSFGTNWADYSRFVGDIFGAPLAAEALFAFFLESVFLGVLLLGRNRVSKRAYTASAWLVEFGSCLSALWIIIANSWMQTPAGYEVVQTASGSKAVLTDFFAAAFNYSTLQRYFHVVIALLIMGALVCIAIGAYYKLKGRDDVAASKLVRVGTIVGCITFCLMLPAAHQQAVVVAEQQPAKLAAMEGQYETGPVDLSAFGWVDENGQAIYALSIPGGTSFLANMDFGVEYPGLNDFPEDERPQGINAIFQTYHIMVALYGVIAVVCLLGLLVMFDKIKSARWPLHIMMYGWIAPILAIESGWFVAEFGRQPWIVYGELKTADAVSASVGGVELMITMVLFLVVYALIYYVFARTFLKTVKQGPDHFLDPADARKEA